MDGTITLGIDVDGVMRDFAGAVDAIYRPYCGEPRTHEYDFRRRYPQSPVIARLALGAWYPALIGAAEAVDGAIDFLDCFGGVREGDTPLRVRFVTYQPTRTSRAVTLAWLSRALMLTPECVARRTEFVRSPRDKQGLDILLDDSPEALDAARARGTLAVCFDHPYNHEYDGPRVKTHAEFLDILLPRI